MCRILKIEKISDTHLFGEHLTFALAGVGGLSVHPKNEITRLFITKLSSVVAYRHGYFGKQDFDLKVFFHILSTFFIMEKFFWKRK